jgi:hypothetical protein
MQGEQQPKLNRPRLVIIDFVHLQGHSLTWLTSSQQIQTLWKHAGARLQGKQLDAFVRTDVVQYRLKQFTPFMFAY